MVETDSEEVPTNPYPSAPSPNPEERPLPNAQEEETEEAEETEENGGKKKPLLQEDSVKIEIHSDKEGEDTPTLPLPERKHKGSIYEETTEKAKLPSYLFPFTRIRNAWNESSNVFQFLGTATCIIFQTVGWFTCVGGIPFLSLAMLAIGSIYKDDCNIQRQIPIYLIVSGVIGTLQHFLAVWIKYVPKNSKGKLKVQRSYCKILNGLFHLFLLIWFIVGSIWIYGAHSEVEFADPQKDEYCHRTLYYFAFWIQNISFILLGLLVFISICLLIFITSTEK